jgi:hypothetical protein
VQDPAFSGAPSPFPGPQRVSSAIHPGSGP